LRSLFAGGVQSLSLTRQEYVEEAPNAREYFELFKHCFGPLVAIYSGLRNEPRRAAAFDEAFLQYIKRWNSAAAEGRVRIPYEYLLVVGRTNEF
jgi:hypothetical protein